MSQGFSAQLNTQIFKLSKHQTFKCMWSFWHSSLESLCLWSQDAAVCTASPTGSSQFGSSSHPLHHLRHALLVLFRSLSRQSAWCCRSLWDPYFRFPDIWVSIALTARDGRKFSWTVCTLLLRPSILLDVSTEIKTYLRTVLQARIV